MPLQTAADVTQRGELFLGEEAAQRQRRIQAGRRVSLGENEAVTILPFGLLRIDVQLFAVEVREHLRGGQAAAGVSAFCGVRSGHDAFADADRRKL